MTDLGRGEQQQKSHTVSATINQSSIADKFLYTPTAPWLLCLQKRRDLLQARYHVDAVAVG